MGVVLYKVMLTAQLIDTINNSYTPAQQLFLVAFPLYAGGTCFILGALWVIVDALFFPFSTFYLKPFPPSKNGQSGIAGGYLLFASANRTWGFAFYPSSLTYWINVFNLLGSAGFFVGSFHLSVPTCDSRFSISLTLKRW